MRLWCQDLIPHLPRQQLLGQHRECAALRGAGWGRPHATVNYVFTHSPAHLIAYHALIMDEMEKRGYHPDPIWRDSNYRGKTLGYVEDEDWICGNSVINFLTCVEADGCNIYPEHNEEYLQECLDNLKSKGINIEI